MLDVRLSIYIVYVGVIYELLNALAVTLFIVHPRVPPRAVDGSIDSQHVLLIGIMSGNQESTWKSRVNS